MFVCLCVRVFVCLCLRSGGLCPGWLEIRSLPPCFAAEEGDRVKQDIPDGIDAVDSSVADDITSNDMTQLPQTTQQQQQQQQQQTTTTGENEEDEEMTQRQILSKKYFDSITDEELMAKPLEPEYPPEPVMEVFV